MKNQQLLTLLQQANNLPTSSYEQVAIVRQLLTTLEQKLPKPILDDSIPITSNEPNPNIVHSRRELQYTIKGQITATAQKIKCIENGTTLAHIQSQITHARRLLKKAIKKQAKLERDMSVLPMFYIKLQFLQTQYIYVKIGKYSQNLSYTFAIRDVLKGLQNTITKQQLEVILSVS